MAYYIKVLLPNDGQAYRVQASSLSLSEDSSLSGLLYGTREKCNDVTIAERAVCLEIRRPYDAQCSILSVNDIGEEHTEIQVRVISHSNMEVIQVDNDIATSPTTQILQGVGQTVFKMRMPYENFGQVYGIYRGESDDSYQDARDNALWRCKSSDDNANSDPGLTDPGYYAVSFAGAYSVLKMCIKYILLFVQRLTLNN